MFQRIFAFALVAALCAACAQAPSTRAAPADPAARVDQIASRATPSSPVLFVGLDGADWQLLDEYMTRGVMPNLSQLVREGTGGVLETIRPPLSPLVWTTMMTGVSPLRHGILDFVQFNAQTRAKEPITSSARRSPAIWNMASNGGKRAAVLGLWATYPAETINGLVVSDRLFNFLFQGNAPDVGVVSPAERGAWAGAALDRAEAETGFDALHAYIPSLTNAEYQQHARSDDPYGHPVSALRRILIETRVYDELGRDAFEREHPDLTIIYLQGTDTIGHTFAAFAPPKQPGVTDADFARYSGVPERYFRMIDERLGEYRRLAAASHAVLMIASDHGFTWKEDRPQTLSSNATTTAAKWHRKEGVYLLWGAAIPAAPGHASRGNVTQVSATLLSLLGLPPARDTENRVLTGVAQPSGAAVDYAALYHPGAAPAAAGSKANADALAKLKSLGYIADAGTAPAASAGTTRTPGSYNNEGVILKEAGTTDEAIAVFQKALAADPNLASALWNLSDLLYAKNDFDRSDDLLVRAFKNRLPEGTRFLIGRAIGYQRAGQADRSLKLISAALDSQTSDAELWLFRGRYRIEAKDCAGAVADFQQAEQLAPRQASAYSSEGLAQMCAGNPAEARRAFGRSLELDPNQPKVREFLKTIGRVP